MPNTVLRRWEDEQLAQRRMLFSLTWENNAVREVNLSAVDAYALQNLEVYCSPAKIVVCLWFLSEEA